MMFLLKTDSTMTHEVINMEKCETVVVDRSSKAGDVTGNTDQ
jgi:hypothetical protein